MSGEVTDDGDFTKDTEGGGAARDADGLLVSVARDSGAPDGLSERAGGDDDVFVVVALAVECG